MMDFRNCRLPVSLLAYLVIVYPVYADPIAATWSDATYGPDGPWPAVQIDVGFSSKLPISMYPGREFASFLLTTDYCSYNSSIPCYASQAGLYNAAQSQLEQSGSDGFIQYAPESDYMAGLKVAGDPATSWVDYWDIGGMTVANVSMALLGRSFAQYPSGDQYPLSVGCFGLGAPETINQTFTNDFGPAVNASLIPGNLWEQGNIVSNSFGLHIGSANPPMPGSLYFGGYDKNRVIGEVLTGEGSTSSPLSLRDITIKVLDGASPWGFESLGGLLASGNSSIASRGIDVSIDGCSPYLSLPTSTCDALASHLPIKYNEKLGLYTWIVDDPQYAQIVGSPSALQFTFLAGSNTKNITISVPFAHLNLTLQAPLVDEDTPYFPCYTGSDRYVLGRAFLQDAFYGANWGANTWWLAQAPGPNIPSADVIELANKATEIEASENNWKESWTGSWRALTPEDLTSSSTSNSTATPESTETPAVETTGFSTGAKAGLGVGIGLGVLALIGAAVFFFRRRKNKKASPASSVTDAEKPAAAVIPAQYPQAPQNTYYTPYVEEQVSPVPTSARTVHSAGAQSYYHPQQQQQQHYQAAPQELTAVDNTPLELPGSDTHYDMPHPSNGHSHQATYGSPQSGYSATLPTNYNNMPHGGKQ